MTQEDRDLLEQAAIDKFARNYNKTVLVTTLRIRMPNGNTDILNFSDAPIAATVLATPGRLLLNWQGDVLMPRWNVCLQRVPRQLASLVVPTIDDASYGDDTAPTAAWFKPVPTILERVSTFAAKTMGKLVPSND